MEEEPKNSRGLWWRVRHTDAACRIAARKFEWFHRARTGDAGRE
jgi:hypothetical protein